MYQKSSEITEIYANMAGAGYRPDSAEIEMVAKQQFSQIQPVPACVFAGIGSILAEDKAL